MNDIMAKLDIMKYLSTTHILWCLMVVLILFGIGTESRLPDVLFKLFDNKIFLFLFISSITLIGTQDWKIAFVIALIFGVIMHKSNQNKIEQFMS